MTAQKSKEDMEIMASPPVKVGEVEYDPSVTHDAVFGTITKDGPNFRGVGWIATSVLMMKSQIGLGVLSIPAAFDTLGLIPGIICLLSIGSMITWSMYVVGQFKMTHREIYGIDDVGGLIFGRIGREVLGVGFTLYLIFGGGSGMLGVSIGLNAVSTHGACTAVFVAVAAIIVICFASIRTLSKMSYLAWGGLVSLLIGIFTVTIAVGVQNHTDDGSPVSDYRLIGSPTFTQAISAVTTFVFAYAGTPLFFPIVAEMRQPRHYTKSMLLCQAVVTVTYLTVGIIVYYYCGSNVASSALGSAGKLIKQIAYGIALPGLAASSTLSIHVASKYPFVRILRGSKHLTANTFIHWSTWLGCATSIALIGYIVASAIPGFGGLVSLVGALFGTLQCFQPMGCMWLYDNWSKGKSQKSLKWIAQVFMSVLMIVVGTFLMVGGTYGSVVGIIDSYNSNGGTRPWTCADNSNSV